jgi:hypothetical protein
MPADSEADLRLEIGHVLLIDIVGYSKLLITEQRDQLQALNEIVKTPPVPFVGRKRRVGPGCHRMVAAFTLRQCRGACPMRS